MTVWRASALVAVFLFAGVVAVTFIPWLAAQYRRYGRLRGWPATVSAAVGLYASGLVAFTLFPLPDDTPGACSRLATWQVRPLASVLAAVRAGSGDGALAFLTTPSVLQVAFNVVLFVPLGLLARWRFGLRTVPAVVLGLAVSVVVEVVQGTAVLGAYPCPYRVADVDDVLTNTVGAATGALLAGPVARLLPHPVPAPEPDLARPGIPRRALAVGIDLIALVSATGVVTLAVALGAAAVGGGAGALDTAAFGTLRSVAGYAVPAVLVGVLPVLGPHRATPGQAAVGLTVVTRDRGRRAARWRVLLRNLIRWGPLAVLVDQVSAVVPVVVPVACWSAGLLLSVLLLPGRRSPSGLLTGTVVGTRAAAEAAAEAAPGPVDPDPLPGSEEASQVGRGG